jgi:hypothetical protein
MTTFVYTSIDINSQAMWNVTGVPSPWPTKPLYNDINAVS